MNELYEELETPKGERKMSRTAKAKDLTKNNQIKDEQRVMLRNLDRIMGKWNGYFDKLLNGENHRFVLGVVHNCQHLPISTQSTNLGGGEGAEAS